MNFSEFPNQWEWVALIIGAVALLMAVQPFLKTIYEGPRIVMFVREDMRIGDYRILECHIANKPITRGILKKLCITRNTATGLIALFDIKEKNTGSKVYSEWPRLASQVGEATQRIDLPAGYVTGRFSVVTIDKANGRVYPGLVPPGKQKSVKVIGVGSYTVDIEVQVGGNVVCRMKKGLVIQTEDPYAYWVNS